MKVVATLFVSVVLLGLCAGSVPGEPLVTDRPDATESSSVVQPGQTQLEAGWLYAEWGGAAAHDLPQTLVRIGVLERAELRVGWGGTIISDNVPDGATDGELGTKVYLCEEDGVLPEAALLASLSIPWGDDGVTTERVDPAFRLACSHTLSDTLSLGYNIGAEWATADGRTLSSLIYSVALGIGLSDTMGAYVEVFGDTGLSADGESHSLNGGLTFLLADNVQLDVLAGLGLSDDAPDWFGGAGVSYRFPE
jgi:hypothetical protein